MEDLLHVAEPTNEVPNKTENGPVPPPIRGGRRPPPKPAEPPPIELDSLELPSRQPAPSPLPENTSENKNKVEETSDELEELYLEMDTEVPDQLSKVPPKSRSPKHRQPPMIRGRPLPLPPPPLGEGEPYSSKKRQMFGEPIDGSRVAPRAPPRSSPVFQTSLHRRKQAPHPLSTKMLSASPPGGSPLHLASPYQITHSSETPPKPASANQKLGISSEKEACDVNTYGIGSSVSYVLKETPRLNLHSLYPIFNIQENNLWKFGASLEETFGIDVTKCMDILQRAGLNSLGTKVGDNVLELISSALALLLILKIIAPELFPLDFSNQQNLKSAFMKAENNLKKISVVTKDFKLEKMMIGGRSVEERLRVSVETYMAKKQKYDWVCDMLELGHSWEEVAGKMLGYTSSLEKK